MKKILLFAFICLFLVGCTAEYKIVLNDDKIEEKLTIIELNKTIFDKETDTGWTVRNSFESLLENDEFGQENYKIKSLTTDDQLGIEYRSSSLKSILSSSIINQCYSNPSIVVDEDIVTISTGNFECYDFYDNLENIKIVFETNYKVISTNADVVEDDSYIWNFTKDSNKSIQISYDSSITKPDYTIYIIIAIIIIILIGVFYFISKKVKIKNEF